MRRNITIQEWQQKQFNIIAREDFKRRMLTEILIDMQICKIEWRNHKEYILDLKNMIDDIVEKNKL
jgi:hypothetical protein